MDEYSELTAQYIQQRFKLPKIVSKKIEQANRFINDPSSALKIILQKNNSGKTDEPAHQNTSHTARVYGHMKRTTTLELEDLSSQRQLISQKMRKYKPANGSFSQFYAQQLSIDTGRSNRSKAEISKKINAQTQRQQAIRKQKIKKYKRRMHPSSIELTKQTAPVRHRVELAYLEKLKSIRENSDMLRQNSRNLLKRADSVVIVNDHSFEKLYDDSNRILTGEQKYILDLELGDDRTTGGAQLRWNYKH